jgi:fructokinase
MMKKVDVLTVGEVLIDMFPAEVGTHMGEVRAFTPKPGGAPANVAVAAKRLGAKSAFIGKVGEDLFGFHLRDVLEEEGVIIQGLRFDREARTTMAIIAMPDENTAEFVFYRNPGADQRLRAEELDRDLVLNTKALHVGSISLTDEPARSATFEAVALAHEAGALVSYDVNYRPSLWKNQDQALQQARRMIAEVDLVKVNAEEAALLADKEEVNPGDWEQVESAAGHILEQGPALVVMTFGGQGSCFYLPEGGKFVAPFQVDTVDAVGCGDAFVAGLLTKLVEDDHWQERLTTDSLTEVLHFANAVGALTSLTRGVIPALPYRTQVEEFLNERS